MCLDYILTQSDGSSVWDYGNQEYRDGPSVLDNSILEYKYFKSAFDNGILEYINVPSVLNYGIHKNILSCDYSSIGLQQNLGFNSMNIKGKVLVDYKLVENNYNYNEYCNYDDTDKYLITIESDSYLKECLGKKTGEYFRIYRLENNISKFIYEKNFKTISPWKVDFGDIDGDGSLDIFIGAITKTEYYPQSKRPFFFTWNGEHLIQKWTGSYIGFNELMDAKLLDTTSDGVDEVVLTVKTKTGELAEEVYRWENFSFYRVK